MGYTLFLQRRKNKEAQGFYGTENDGRQGPPMVFKTKDRANQLARSFERLDYNATVKRTRRTKW